MTGSNVINVLKGSLPPGAKAFLLVTDNRRSRLESPFCLTIQQRKFEFGHHRQRKKISNAQELTVQLSQTLSSAVEQIKVSNNPITNHTKKDIAPAPSSFLSCLLRQARHILNQFCFELSFYRRQISKPSISGYITFQALVEYIFVLLN